MEDPYISPKEDPAADSQKPEAPAKGRQVARSAFVVYGVLSLLAAFAACTCPGFFACMGICAVVALVAGSRIQRIVSVALLLAAIFGFVVQFRAEQRQALRIKRLQEAPAQR